MFWKRFIIGLLIVLNLFLAYKLLGGEQGLFGYQDLKGDYERLEEKIAELDRKNLQLSEEIRLLQSDRRYIEKIIREKMHYVKENELLYMPESSANASQQKP